MNQQYDVPLSVGYRPHSDGATPWNIWKAPVDAVTEPVLQLLEQL